MTNMDSVVAAGRAPWLPHPHAHDVVVLHMHDVPLIGTFALDEGRVLFVCLSGDTGNFNVWAYAQLSGVEAKSLEKGLLRSVDDLHDDASMHLRHRNVVFATALDFTIREWSPIDVQDEPLEGATRFLRLVTSRSSGETAGSRVEQSALDAATRELATAP